MRLSGTRLFAVCALAGSTCLAAPPANCPNAGLVLSHTKISDTTGGFLGQLGDVSLFGSAIAPLGDLDGDGVTDIAVGARNLDDGGPDRGAVWVLFMYSDGTVKAEQKISSSDGGLTGPLNDADNFGASLASLGDIDGDGVVDIAVGAEYDNDGGPDHGAVWILFLNSDGTVKAEQKISDTQGGLTGTLDNNDRFGAAVTSLGDLDTDGVTDIAVCARYDDDGGKDRGALWVLFLNTNGTVKAEQKISDTDGGFMGQLDNDDNFGSGLASLDDLDGDGVIDIAAGAEADDDGGFDRGAMWVLFLNTNGTVKAEQKISDTDGGFMGQLDNEDHFGQAIASLGDMNADGVIDLAVGAKHDDDGGSKRGAVWVLFLNTDGTVNAEQKISDTAGGFLGLLDDEDQFGVAVGAIGDLDGDGFPELAVGANLDGDGGTRRGAVYILTLDACGFPPTITAHPASLLIDPCDRPDSVTLTVSAGGDDPFSYQWRRNGVPIDGAVARNLTILDPDRGDTGYYDCLVTSPLQGAIDSSDAVIAFWPSPCPGDLDDDCDIDVFDFATFATNFGCGAD